MNLVKSMCGIGGKVSFRDGPSVGLGHRMNECHTHRGPNAEGVYANGPAVLAHRRLSILDTTDRGRQPMSNDDETVHIVFNGEIYNYVELRERLNGYTFRSETDTEVLLHLYEEFGLDCLNELRGMFAFAIWDEKESRLFLARDRLGQKPLFYRHDGERESLVFGSTIKSILADETVEAVPDNEALREYLTYQYVPHPRTGFEGIYQLGPAERAVFTADGFHQSTYWSPSFRNQSTASPTVLADRVRDSLREATRLRMRSDVPIGVFLSGGLDSSIVTALMADLSDSPIRTFSIGFDDESRSELDYARPVAEMYDTDHRERIVTPDCIDLLPRLVEEYEMPFADSSALPTYYVSQEASEDVTVALSGDAGDETFAGYNRYTRDWILERLARLPIPVTRLGTKVIDALPGKLENRNRLQRGKRALSVSQRDPVDRYASLVTHASVPNGVATWAGSEPADEFRFLREAFERTDGPTRMDRLTHVDLQTYLPCDLLVKVDRASMAHSLEVRSPFLDHRFVELATRIPAKYKWRRGNKKWLLKRAFSSHLPDEVIHREKQGFGIPIHAWFRGELREFAREKLRQLGSRDQFHEAKVTSLLERHVSGAVDDGYRIWDHVLLEMWYERFVDG